MARAGVGAARGREARERGGGDNKAEHGKLATNGGSEACLALGALVTWAHVIARELCSAV